MKKVRAIIDKWRILENYCGQYEIAGDIVRDIEGFFKPGDRAYIKNIENIDLKNSTVETEDSKYFLLDHLYKGNE